MTSVSDYIPNFMRLDQTAVAPTQAPKKKKGALVQQISSFDTVRPGTEYRADRALAMAELANLAYDDAPTVEAKLKKSGFKMQSYYEVKGAEGLIINSVDTQCFIATKGDVVVLSFRGTDGFSDAMTDIAALFRVTKRVGKRETQVHRGFENAHSALRGRAFNSKGKPLLVTKTVGSEANPNVRNLALHEEIKALVEGPPRKKLYITGHSLGAALGTLEGFDLAREGVAPEAIYTIGSPRIGDPAFQDEYDRALKTRTFRHVNFSDAVPRVPFDFNYLDIKAFEFELKKGDAWLLKKLGFPDVPAGKYGPSQYRHVGTEKYIGNKGTILEPAPNLGKEFYDWVSGARTTLENHKSGAYLTMLRALAKADTVKSDPTGRAVILEHKADSFATPSK